MPEKSESQQKGQGRGRVPFLRVHKSGQVRKSFLLGMVVNDVYSVVLGVHHGEHTSSNRALGTWIAGAAGPFGEVAAPQPPSSPAIIPPPLPA